MGDWNIVIMVGVTPHEAYWQTMDFLSKLCSRVNIVITCMIIYITQEVGMENMFRYVSPINPAIYPQLSLILLAIGVFFMAWFFVYPLQHRCISLGHDIVYWSQVLLYQNHTNDISYHQFMSIISLWYQTFEFENC